MNRKSKNRALDLLLSLSISLCVMSLIALLPVLAQVSEVADPNLPPLDPWKSLWKFASDNLAATLLGAGFTGYLFFERYKVLPRLDDIDERSRKNFRILQSNNQLLRALVYKFLDRIEADRLTGGITDDDDNEDTL